MEEKSASIWKTTLTYGLYLALISIAISVVVWAGGLLESMGLFGGIFIALGSFLITFIVMFMFARSFRNNELGGYASFGDIFKFAILVILFSTLISLIYTYIFHTFIDPGYTEHIMAVMQQKTLDFMASKGVPEAQMDKAIEKFQEIPTMAKTLWQSALGGLIGGAIISLIVAAIVKKKEEGSIE